MAKVIQADIPCDGAYVRLAPSVRSINIRLSFSAAHLHASLRPYYVLLPLVDRLFALPLIVSLFVADGYLVFSLIY
jgi:hypothetical protein